eukprot:CAMPEP_0114973390 /NCGR_PEP_ID=MMETSP0216-20121206/926_1 /TAXON_ID=223996 /ORGANISM="Protocruzia adherens, Strain Boccale" /LENGTH=472 /DNA_ID=CAMNT_0002333873 /DNA_START=808 /DNA_END=2227 /DNA_ORIENTATION=-
MRAIHVFDSPIRSFSPCDLPQATPLPRKTQKEGKIDLKINSNSSGNYEVLEGSFSSDDSIEHEDSFHRAPLTTFEHYSTFTRKPVEHVEDSHDLVSINMAVDFGHLQITRNFYVTLISVLTGITISLRQESPSSIHPKLEIYDKLAKDIMDQDIYHSFHVEIKVYFALQFESIRRRMGVHLEDLFDSLDPLINIEALKSAKRSAGKSGSFFLFTTDGKYILKTISHDDVKAMRSLGKGSVLEGNSNNYFEYLEQHSKTFLGRVLGAFRLRHAFFGSKLYVCLMENVNTCLDGSFRHLTYDLKGSSYSRSVLAKSSLRNFNPEEASGKILKDNDFKHIEQEICLSDEDYSRLVKQVEHDVNFLEERNLMDYSLLITISTQNSFSEFSFPNQKHRIYFGTNIHGHRVMMAVGIIDYFQQFTFGKKMELTMKKVFTRAAKDQISSQAPDIYASRFLCGVHNVFTNPSLRPSLRAE